MTNLFESSLEDLYKSSVLAFPNTTKRQHATHPIEIKEIRIIPFVGMKTLFLKALVQNEENQYSPIMLFKGVNYNKNDAKLMASDGKIYDLEKLSFETTDVLLRCNCEDFFWRFNFTNHTDKSLYGTKRKKYESKGGAPANPLKKPGMCKHIMKLYQSLNDSGIFNE